MRDCSSLLKENKSDCAVLSSRWMSPHWHQSSPNSNTGAPVRAKRPLVTLALGGIVMKDGPFDIGGFATINIILMHPATWQDPLHGLGKKNLLPI